MAKEFRLVIVLEEGVCSTADDVASELRRVANRVSEGTWRLRDTDGAPIRTVWGVRG